MCNCLKVTAVKITDQIVMLGPTNKITGQYEYLVLSNWAKYPLIAMTRDYNDFMRHYRDEFVRRFKQEGFMGEFSRLANYFIVFAAALYLSQLILKCA